MKKIWTFVFCIFFASSTVFAQQTIISSDERTSQLTEMITVKKSLEDKIVSLRQQIKDKDSLIMATVVYIKSIESQLAKDAATADNISKRRSPTSVDKKKLKELLQDEKKEQVDIERAKDRITGYKKKNEDTLRSITETNDLIKAINSKIDALNTAKQ